MSKDPSEMVCLRAIAAVLNYMYEVGEEEVLRQLRDCGEDWSYFKYLGQRLKEDE